METNLVQKAKYPCQGIVFKAEVYHYLSKRGAELKFRLRRLKRKSCSGCLSCDWQEEELMRVSDQYPIAGMTDIKHGELYMLSVKTLSTDPETGIADDWGLVLLPFDPKDFS